MGSGIRSSALVLLCLTSLSLLFVSGGGDSDLFEFAVLDVGQGQCVVFRTPQRKVVVIDCGSTSSKSSGRFAGRTAEDYLKYCGLNHIDLVILSHPHDDHVNGLPTLISKMKTSAVLDIGASYPSPEYKEVLKLVKSKKIKYQKAYRGLSARIDPKTVVYILHPKKNGDYPDLNENSMVVRVIYGGISFLIAADAGTYAELEMLAAKQKVRSHVLVVGHHGSKTGSSPEWLGAVKPKTAVISVGKNNKYNLPSKEVLVRLASLKVKVYRTDRDGAVVFSTNGSNLRVKTYK